MVRVVPLRDFFLQPANYAASRSQLVHRFGELMRKIWNPRNFKGQVGHSHRSRVGKGASLLHDDKRPYGWL